jgi:hypothetical protein
MIGYIKGKNAPSKCLPWTSEDLVAAVSHQITNSQAKERAAAYTVLGRKDDNETRETKESLMRNSSKGKDRVKRGKINIYKPPDNIRFLGSQEDPVSLDASEDDEDQSLKKHNKTSSSSTNNRTGTSNTSSVPKTRDLVASERPISQIELHSLNFSALKEIDAINLQTEDSDLGLDEDFRSYKLPCQDFKIFLVVDMREDDNRSKTSGALVTLLERNGISW